VGYHGPGVSLRRQMDCESRNSGYYHLPGQKLPDPAGVSGSSHRCLRLI